MSAPFSITDHALLRWLERRHGIDVEWMRDAMRAEIEGAQNSNALSYVGSNEELHLVVDGLTYIFEDGRCITVLPVGGRPMKLRRARGRRDELCEV